MEHVKHVKSRRRGSYKSLIKKLTNRKARRKAKRSPHEPDGRKKRTGYY